MGERRAGCRQRAAAPCGLDRSSVLQDPQRLRHRFRAAVRPLRRVAGPVARPAVACRVRGADARGDAYDLYAGLDGGRRRQDPCRHVPLDRRRMRAAVRATAVAVRHRARFRGEARLGRVAAAGQGPAHSFRALGRGGPDRHVPARLPGAGGELAAAVAGSDVILAQASPLNVSLSLEGVAIERAAAASPPRTARPAT